MKRTLLAALFAVVTGVTSPPSFAAELKELTFATIQTEEMAHLAKKWGPILKHLEKKTGLKFNFYTTTSYASVIEAMMSGFVHVAELGPKSYLIAHDKSAGEIVPLAAIAAPPDAFDAEPCPCYYGTLITRKASSFTSLESLKGKSLALVDPGSTSGDALPRVLFTEEKLQGKPLESHFGRIFYSGSHAASIRAVHQNKAEAAFVSQSIVGNLISRGEIKKEDFNYLWKSPRIPIDAITYHRKKLPAEIAEKLKAALTEMSKDPEAKSILVEADFAGFESVDDKFFDPVRKMVAFEKKK